jgi:nitroimidazol reductase NimA-like FMN-containing flavoprotein (pyridoxamine 5'-phosphate oxidase superfamily)
MGRGEKEIIKKDVLHFLRRQRVAVVATVSAKGKPFAAPVFYNVDNNFNFYFFTKDESQKYLNLKENNTVAITIFTESSPQTVQAQGLAQLVKNPKEIINVTAPLFKRAMDSSQWYDPPIAKLKNGQLVVIKVKPTWLRFGDFRGVTGHPKSQPFQQIIP